MAIAKTKVESLPPWAQATARDIQMMGLEFYFFEDYHLADMGKLVQVRDDEDIAPRGRVIEYTERMRAGDQFPPAIFTTDDWLISGITRELAATAAHKKSFPAFRLKDAHYKDAPDSLLEKLITLGAWQNHIHGTDHSAKNKARIIEWVAKMKGDNPSVDDIAKQLHVRKQLVRDVLSVAEARERADRLGVDLSTRKLSWTHYVRLGTASNKLDTEVFRAFARLTMDTNVSTTEMQSIMNALFKCEDNEQRLAIIATEKGSRAMTTSGLNRRPPVAAQYRQHAGFIIKQGSAGTAPGQLLVETGSLQAAEDQYKLFGTEIEVLRKARSLQYEYIEKLLREQGSTSS